MKFTAAIVAVIMVAAGMSLGGCATRESVRNAQAAADAADRHAGMAQARADEAYGVGNNAMTVGNNAMAVGNNALSSAQAANGKADLSAADIVKLKKRVAYLEYKTLPHHKKKIRHHRAPAAAEQSKPSNS